MIHILAELAPLKVSDGSRPVLRASSAQDRALNGVASQTWWPAISKRPALAIPLFDGDFTQDVEAATASFTVRLDGLVNLDSDARGYRWAGAPVSIYAIDTSTALNAAGSYDVASLDAIRAFKGRVEGFNLVGNALTITAEIDKEPFEKDVLALTYAGTGDAEGGQDLKGRLKPWIFGRALNVEPILVNSVDSVVQFSAYPVQGISALYERGASFGPSIGNYPTYAALVAANIPAGKWATCHALGMARLGAPPYGVITGDVDGDNTSGFLRRTGAIIQRIATARGIATALIDTASLNALDAAVPYDINLVLTDQISVLDLARRLARPCNAQAGLDFQGRLFAVRPTIGTPALTLDAQGRQLPPVRQCQEAEVSAPYKRIMFGANRSWRVHTFDEIAFDAELIDRGDYDPAKTYRRGNIVSLPNGSRWLYVSDTPKAGSMPSETNADWELMTGAITAGNITYEDGTPVEELKPAEPGATDGMNDEERDEFDQLAADTATAQTNIAAAQAQIAAIEGSVTADIGTLTGQVGAVTASLDALADEVGAVTSDLGSLASDVGAVTANVGDLAQQVGLVTADLTSLSDQVTSAGGDIETIKTTLGQQGASISAIQLTASNHTGQIAQLTTDLSTANANIGVNASAISTTNSNLAQLTTRVTTAESAVVQNATAITNVTGRTASLETSVTAQGASIGSLLSATSTQAGQIAQLTTQVSAGNPNLCPGLELGLTGWTWENASFQTFNGDGWGVFAFSTTNPADGAFAFLRSPAIPIDGSQSYTAALDAAVGISGGTVNSYIQFEWLDENGATIWFTSGPAKSGGYAFDSSGANRRALAATGESPGHAVAVKIKMVVQKVSGTLQNFNVRQVKLEKGTVATAYSGEASAAQSWTAITTATTSLAQLTTRVTTAESAVIQNATAITNVTGRTASLETSVTAQGASIGSLLSATSTHTGQIAQLTTDLSTANANIGVNASAISTTNSNLAQLTTRVTTAESAVIQNATAITNVTGRTASLETSVTAQGASIGSLLSATSTQAGQIAQLTTQVSAGNPNLCPGLELGLTGWTWENASFQTFNGDGWGVFAFSTTNPADGAFAFLRSPAIPIDGSQSYTAALDAAVGISGGTVNSYIQFEWLDENGATIWFTSGPAKSGGYAFDSSGANRRALAATGESPGHAVAVKIKMVVQKVSGTLQNFNVRQVKLEKGTVATAYSGEASAAQSWTAITTATTSLAQLTTRVTTAESAVIQNATAITNVTGRTASLETSVTAQGASIGSLLSATSTHTGQIAQLTTDLSTANANIGVNASAISTTNSNLAQLTTRVTTAESAVIQNATAITNVTGRTASLETSVTAQGASIGSLLSATSTQAGQIAQLTTQVSAGNPNLCPGLELGLTGWTWENASFQTFNGDGWGVFAFSTTNPADGAFAFLRSPAIPIDGSQSYTAALDAAVGISGGTVNSYIQFEWLDENGATIWFTSGPAKSGGYAFDSSGANRRALAATGESPGHAVAVKIKMVVQKASGTLQNFNVRQVKLEKGTVATAYSGEASIIQSFQALSTLTTQYASLSSTVSTQGVTISTQATAISTLQSNVTSLFAKWSLELDVNGYVSGMVTNNNGTRADLTLRMDKVKMVTPSGLGGYWQVIFDGQGRPTQTIGDDSSGVTIEIGYLA